ncbi:Chromate transport protein ChrA [Methylorubrum populi]|uniref:Chromate transport protein ChrA n=1 Tax=Methylorubrum populi TaxID=223967 RepID=A0A833JAJ6_9HYPH|nr:Chromate transport protein ChrA [Methylorubrum populi]
MLTRPPTPGRGQGALNRCGPDLPALKPRRGPRPPSATRGTNTAVAGVLGAAFYDPVWTGAVGGPQDFALATVAFVLC